MDFDELYEQEFRKTYQYIRYMVSNAQVAEDLCVRYVYANF